MGILGQHWWLQDIRVFFLDGARDSESPSLQCAVGIDLIEKATGPMSSVGEVVPNAAVNA